MLGNRWCGSAARLEQITPLLYSPIGLDLKRAQRARENSLKLRRPGDYPRRPGNQK